LATIPGREQESRTQIKQICDDFESSEPGKRVLLAVRENQKPASKGESSEPKLKVRSPYKASWFSQFRAVLWRSWISVIREPAVLRVKAFQTIVSRRNLFLKSEQKDVLFNYFLLDQFISGLIAAIFQGQEYTLKNLPNFQGALFVFLTNMTFQNVFGVVNVSGQIS
jgi:hypothetical protein